MFLKIPSEMEVPSCFKLFALFTLLTLLFKTLEQKGYYAYTYNMAKLLYGIHGE